MSFNSDGRYIIVRLSPRRWAVARRHEKCLISADIICCSSYVIDAASVFDEKGNVFSRKSDAEMRLAELAIDYEGKAGA